MSQLFERWAEEDKAAGYASGENVRPALDVAAGTTADREARDRELSKSLGFPSEVISEQRDWAENEQKAREIEKNPLFAQWAAEDKTHAAFARDDTDAMRDTFDIIEGAKRSGLRHSILVFQAQHGDTKAQKILMDEAGLSEEEQRYGTFSQTPMPGVIPQAGAAFKEGFDAVARGVAGTLVLVGENMQGQTTDEEGNAVPYLHNNAMAALARSARSWLEARERSQSAPLHPEGWGYDVVRQVPQLFGTIGVGALTGGLGAGLFMGANIAGNEYLDLTAKKDVFFPSAAQIEEQARLMALAMEHGGEDWQKTVNAARLASYDAGGKGGTLYAGQGEPSEWAMAAARARIIASAILNTEMSVPQGTAAIASLGNALVQTPLERIGLGKLVSIFKTSGFGSMIKGIAEHAATEFITETIQQHPEEFSQMWAEGVTRGDSVSDILQRYTGEFWDITKRGMYSGLVAVPFGGLGGMVRVASNASMARSARDWFVSQRAFHQKFEELKAAQIAPDVARSILEKGGMTGEVSIPAADVLRLHQEGSPVLEALGWDLTDVQVEAERKGDMTVSLPWVHTSLHGADFDTFMTYARPSVGNAWSMAEAEQFDTRAAEDVDKLVAEAAADEQERSDIDREAERIESEMREAIMSIPGLRTEIKGTGSLQDLDAAGRDTVDSVVRHNMEVIMRLARRFSASGMSASDFLSRIRLQGMKMDERGRLLTPEEFERHMQDVEAKAQEAAMEEADAPFWDAVWGRLEAGSLDRDFPDARKELGGIHGRGLFAKKGKGVAVDELADELKTAGWLPEDTDSSTLVEMLKGKRSPKTRKTGKVSPVLLQDVIAAEQKLAAEVAAWEKQVDEQKQKPSNNLLMLEQTPLIMHMLGADFRRLYLAPHAFDGVFPGQKTNETHNIHTNITKCVLKKIPAAMADPIMVFDAKGDRLVFMLEIEDENGASVIVPVEVEKAKDSQNKPINLVVSVYSKDVDNGGKTIPNSEWFVRQAQKNLRYVNTAKVSEWAAFSGVQFPFDDLRNTRKKKILTETDLVKLKEEFPTLYQYKKRTPLWESAPHFQPGDPDSVENPPRITGQSGVDGRSILPNSSESNTLFQTAYHGTPHKLDNNAIQVLNTFYQGRENSMPQTPEEALASGSEAMERVITEQTDVLDAMSRPDVGSISFYWGTPGKGPKLKGGSGVSHLIAHRNAQGLDGEAIARKMPEVLAYGKISGRQNAAGGDRIFISHDNHTAVLSLYRFGNRETWLVTGWLDDKPSGAQAKVYDSADATSAGSTRFQSSDGAEGKTTIQPLGADGKPLFHDFMDRAPRSRSLSEAAMARGFVTIARGQEYTIQLLKTANLSTILHETGHIALLEMNRLVSMGMADEAMARDYAVLRDYLGLKEGNSLTDMTPEMVAANEKFAKAMELYMREGKAPAKGLESAFARFKRWLTRIYREVVDDPYFKGVKLNDDVRQVFDRLLADENEIRRASERAGISEDIRAELDALGLKGSRRARVTSLIQEAREQAEENLKKARDAHRTAQLAEWKKQAVEEMQDEPEYKALRAIREVHGLNRDAVVQLVGENMARQLVKRAPGSVTEKSDVFPETIAWEAGFDTPEAMIAALVSYPKVKDRIAELVQEKQQKHDANFDAEEFLFEADALAASEEEIGRAIDEVLDKERYRAELSGQTVDGKPVQPTEEQAQDYGNRVYSSVSRDIIKERAKQLLDAMPLRSSSSPYRYRQAVKRLFNEERRALIRKDWSAAMEANYQLRLNMEMARQAEKLRQSLERFESKVKKFCAQEKNDPRARYAVAALAVPYGIVPASSLMERTAQGKDWKSIEAWAGDVTDEGYAVTLNPELFIRPEAILWKSMKSSEFLPLFDELNMIMGIETDRRKVNTAAGRKELKTLGEELAASIYKENPKRNTKTAEDESGITHILKTVHAEHLKADTIAMLADGDRMGPVWQAIIRPVNEAQKDENVRFKAAREAIRRLFSVYDRKDLVAMRKNRVFVQSLNGGRGEYITKEKALCALLNLGNESNTQRLMDGMGWNEKQLQDVLSLLDDRDWDFAQSVWDYLETFRDESFALEERITGVQPTAIQAREIVSPSGKRYRGGYYPVKYDGRKASGNINPEDRMSIHGLAFASVEHGSMKERVGSGAGTPLDLRLDVMTDHVSRTVHNLSFREAVINVGKVLRQPDFKKAFTETAGTEQYRQLQNWLADVAGTQNQTMGSMDKAASWVRAHTALYTMGFKATTMLAQLSGGLATSVEIGPQWMLHGTAHVFGHGTSGIVRAYREACSLSPMMANRINSFEREVADATRKLMDYGSSNKILDPVVRVNEWIRQHAYIPVGYVQLAVDLPTFWGAYYKAMKENGGNEKAALEYAEHIVEITQVGGATKDLAGIQRHGELMKLFTMYYSYFSVLYNISARRVTMMSRHRDLPSAMRLAGLSMLWFVEPLISEFLAGRGPDDEDEWQDWMATTALFNPFSMVVGVRDVVKYYQNMAEGKPWGYVASPAFDTVSTLARGAAVPVQILLGDKELDKKSVKAMAKGAGMALGSPLLGAQSITTLSNMWDWLDGTKDPELRDLIFAQRK